MPSGGRRPGSGRPRGGSNNLSREIKEAIGKAFKKLGGAKYLENLGRTDPKAFTALLSRVVPTELATSDGPVRHEVVLKWMTPEMAKNRGYDFDPSQTRETGKD